MPLYEYVCLDCGARKELLRSMSAADEVAPCDYCGSEHVKRLLSRFCARSTGSDGMGVPGNSCASCSGKNCAACSASP